MAIYSNRIVISISKTGVGPWLRITNSQNIPAQAGLQVMWQVPVSTLQTRFAQFNVNLNSNLSNMRFVYNGQFVPAWLESINNGTATIWIKMPVSIPANSSITLNLYANPGLNFDGIYWGEAPQLSTTYGQYDNGTSVFGFYENFAGTSLSSRWQELTSSGDTYTVNNGITFNNAGNGYYVSIGTNSAVSPSGMLEMNIVSGSSARPTIELATTDTQIRGGQPIYMYENGYGQSFGMYSGNMQFEILTTKYNAMNNGGPTYNSPLIEGIGWVATGSQILEIIPNYNYTNIRTVSETNSSVSLSTPLYIMIGQAASGNNANTGNLTVQWLRTRAYPPNGVMPTVELM